MMEGFGQSNLFHQLPPSQLSATLEFLTNKEIGEKVLLLSKDTLRLVKETVRFRPCSQCSSFTCAIWCRPVVVAATSTTATHDPICQHCHGTTCSGCTDMPQCSECNKSFCSTCSNQQEDLMVKCNKCGDFNCQHCPTLTAKCMVCLQPVHDRCIDGPCCSLCETFVCNACVSYAWEECVIQCYRCNETKCLQPNCNTFTTVQPRGDMYCQSCVDETGYRCEVCQTWSPDGLNFVTCSGCNDSAVCETCLVVPDDSSEFLCKHCEEETKAKRNGGIDSAEQNRKRQRREYVSCAVTHYIVDPNT